MAGKDKNFYEFKISYRNQSERQKNIDELKKKYPLSTILKALQISDADEDDEESLENKVRQALQRELAAMTAAENNALGGFRSDRYQNHTDKNGKPAGGKIPEIADYFAAEDDWLNNHDNKYSEYSSQKYEYERAGDQEKLKALDEQYKSTLDAFQKCEDRERSYNEYKELLDFLERNPRSVNNSLLTFYEQCRKAGKEAEFDNIYGEFIANRKFRPQMIKDKDGRVVETQNEHHFKIDNNNIISHSILNLQGSGLDISWVNSRFGLAHCPENLTEAQLKALAEYCHQNGIDIEEYLRLNELRVLDDKGADLGSAAEQLKKKLQEMDEHDAAQNAYKLEGQDLSASKDSDGKLPDLSELLGSPLKADTDVFSYIKGEKDLNVSKTAMVNAAKKRIGIIGYRDESLMAVSSCWNGTVISVYKNENDRLKDGEVDKNGYRTHTKEFSCRLYHKNPPHAQFYLEQGKEFKAAHARVMLDAFKACGCKYFIFPSADEIGGAAFTAFLEASGKGLMVPLCKRSKKSPGVYLDVDHVAAILEVIKKEDKQDVDQLLDFQIRLLRELKAQETGRARENPSYKTNSKLNTKMTVLEGTIKFSKFQSSYLGSLQSFVNDGLAGKYGEKWDEVDRAAAFKALQHIAEDMEKGKLLGGGFDPLDSKKDNLDKMKKAMVFYMTAEKPRILDEINKQISSSADVKDSKISSTVRNVCSTIEKDVINGYFGDYLKNEWGVEGCKPQINGAMEKYKPGKYMEKGENLDHIKDEDGHYNNEITKLYRTGTPKEIEPLSCSENPEDEHNKFSRQCKDYLKDVTAAQKNNQKALTFAEWKKKREAAASR